MQVFTPAWNNVTAVTNSASATAAVELPFDSDAVLLTNTSSTARVHVLLTYYDSGTASTGTAPTTSTGLPILPNSQIRVAVPRGVKVLRTIATAADGTTFINPGKGG